MRPSTTSMNNPNNPNDENRHGQTPVWFTGCSTGFGREAWKETTLGADFPEAP